MTYREKISYVNGQASSREESLALLARYRDELSEEEYGWIYSSIATHAIEGMFLDEQAIVMGIAQLRGEITEDEVFSIARSLAA